MRLRFLVAVAALLLASTGFGQAKDAFEKFKVEPLGAKGSYQRIPDPTGDAQSPMVESFTILPGKCKGTDCQQKSVRSQVYEPKPFQKQPKEAWYGWSMYLPADFPAGSAQAATGLYSLAYWHNGDCPHVGFVSDTGFGTKLRLQTMTVPKDGSNDCHPDTMIEFADLDDLRGEWHRFEVHIKWSTGDDGMVDVFLDGEEVVSFSGRTVSLEKPTPNYFKYGVYLCCTKGNGLVAPATILYKDIARADTREGLTPTQD